MNAKIEQYIAEQKALIAAEKQRQQHEVLDELELYECEKEYAEGALFPQRAAALGYTQEIVDGKAFYYKMSKKVYPELTEEELAALQELKREKEAVGLVPMKETSPMPAVQSAPVVQADPTKYRVDAQTMGVSSFGAKLMRVLAVLMWIGGLIAAFTLGRTPDRYGEIHFNFVLFMTYLGIFIIGGLTYWAIGELFENIASINSGVHGLQNAQIKPEK